MQAHPGRIFEFGPFRLVERERQLLKDGRPIALPPKVFDTLVALVENRGRLMDKGELMGQLWPGSFVEEANLNRSISSLRKALGETARRTTYIETVPKCGYRFLAPVIEVEADDAAFIVEKHTSAEIITEEEEEISDSSNSEFENSFGRATATVSPTSRFSRLRRHALMMAVVVTAIVLAAVVYVWTAGNLGRAATTVKVKSLAVLPFRDVGAAGDEHLGMSLADVVITRLGNLKDVNVRPTSALLRFEGQNLESTDEGRALGVDAVLEGSIYRSDERIRVTARLVRVSDQSPIWSGQFDNKVSDVLALQNAIAVQVADALSLNLSADEKASLGRRYSESADALQLYSKGRFYWNERTWDGMAQAEYYFRRAIEKDPNFALAYVGLADKLFFNKPQPEAYSAVQKAIELDPNLGEAYATAGFASMFQQWDWQEAEKNFKRAIELRPGYGVAHQWYATLLAITGRVNDAEQEMQRALEIDPTSANFLADAGQMLYFAREYEKAEAYCRKALEVTPDFTFAHKYLLDIYLKTGKSDDAFGEYANRGGKSPDDSLKALYLESGMNGLLRRQIDGDLRSVVGGFSYEVARLHALLGDNDQSLTWLEKSYENKDFLLPFVNADPIFDTLRSEPRFEAVLRRMNLAH